MPHEPASSSVEMPGFWNHVMPAHWFDLPNAPADAADVLLLPLPYEGTVSYGSGTARGPGAILEASTQVELWDTECRFDFETLAYHTAPLVEPAEGDTPEGYHQRVTAAATGLHTAKRDGALVVGLGGEHGLTPPLVRAAVGGDDLAGLTVVQFDAHADLRDEYEGTPLSHACAMRPLVKAGARLLAIGIRSADRTEHEFAEASDRVTTYHAHELNDDGRGFEPVHTDLAALEGDVYLTIDVDVLDPSLCPGTGTPVPGGLTWAELTGCLRRLFEGNVRLVGADVVETAPSPGTVINEFTAALLVARLAALRFG